MNLKTLSAPGNSTDLASLVADINSNFSTIYNYTQAQETSIPHPVIKTASLTDLGAREALENKFPAQRPIGSYAAYDLDGLVVACCYDENNNLVSSFPFPYIDKRFHNTSLLSSIPARSLLDQTDMTCTLIYQAGAWNIVQNIPQVYSDGTDLYYRLGGNNTTLRINAPESAEISVTPGISICAGDSQTGLVTEISGKPISELDPSLYSGNLALVLVPPGIYYISILSRSGGTLRWSVNENLKIDPNKGLREILSRAGWVWQAFVSPAGIASHTLLTKNNRAYLTLQKNYTNTETEARGKYLNILDLMGIEPPTYKVHRSTDMFGFSISEIPVIPGESWYIEFEEETPPRQRPFSSSMYASADNSENIPAVPVVIDPIADNRYLCRALIKIPADNHYLCRFILYANKELLPSEKKENSIIKIIRIYKEGGGLNIDEPTKIQGMLTSDSGITIGPFQHLNTAEAENKGDTTGTGHLRANKINANNIQVNKIVSHSGGQNLQLSNGNELQYIGFRYSFPWGKSTQWNWARYKAEYDELYQIYKEKNFADNLQSYQKFRDFCYMALSGARYMRYPLMGGTPDENDRNEKTQLSKIDPVLRPDGPLDARSIVWILGTEPGADIDSENTISVTRIHERPEGPVTEEQTYKVFFNNYARYPIYGTYARSVYRADTDALTVVRVTSNAPVGTRIPLTCLAASIPVLIRPFSNTNIDDDLNITITSSDLNSTSGYGYISGVGDLLFTIGFYTISIKQDGSDIWPDYYGASSKDKDMYVDGFSASGIYSEKKYKNTTDTNRVTFLENITEIYKGSPEGVSSSAVLSEFATNTGNIMKNITNWFIKNNIYKASSGYTSMLSGNNEAVLATIDITQNFYVTNTGSYTQIVAARSEIIARKS